MGWVIRSDAEMKKRSVAAIEFQRRYNRIIRSIIARPEMVVAHAFSPGQMRRRFQDVIETEQRASKNIKLVPLIFIRKMFGWEFDVYKKQSLERFCGSPFS